MQEDAGLRVVTDGETRRSFWHYDFMGMLDGLTLEERDEGVQFAGVKLRPIFPTITGKLDFPDDHPMLEHFKFVANHMAVTPKISIPGPHVAISAPALMTSPHQNTKTMMRFLRTSLRHIARQ